MFAKFPAPSFFQVQTLGGVYADASMGSALHTLECLGNLVGRRRDGFVAHQRAILVQLADPLVPEPEVIEQDPLIVLTQTSRTQLGAILPCRKFHRHRRYRYSSKKGIFDPAHGLALVQMRMSYRLVKSQDRRAWDPFLVHRGDRIFAGGKASQPLLDYRLELEAVLLSFACTLETRLGY